MSLTLSRDLALEPPGGLDEPPAVARGPNALAAAFALLVLAAPAPAAPRGVDPVRVAHARQADALKAAYLADRADTEKWLRESPTSYLAAVGRTDFEAKASLVLGRAAACDLRVDDPELAPEHLRVTVRGDSFDVRALGDTATFQVKGERRREATLAPGFVRVGRFTVRLSHQRFPALIVFDPKSPHLERYHGLRWYAPDLAYRFEVPLTPNPAADTVVIQSTRGNARRAVLAGWFDLNVKGKPVRLEAHRLLEPGVDEQSVSIFFRDATTGRETYGVGRYVDPERLPDGRWLVDLNHAYNPACAVSPHYNCPIPSKANSLKVAIRAGEKDSGYER
jgi:hypothetical protein